VAINRTEPNAKAGKEPDQAPSPPSISLPKGGGAIGGMGEKFAANPVTGTGSMSVPIVTSPRRFGPQLSVSYDSGAGNGPFGLGWNLSLPFITRKTEKGLPRYFDADESDVFILSGAEDLVPLLRKSVSGELEIHEDPRIIDNETYRVRRYRPRIESLFARIERWTNVADATDVFWRSISKDNITTWYGKTAESRIADPADAARIFSWLICESHDDKGNVIAYEYKKEDSNGVDGSQAHEANRKAPSGLPDPRSANRYLKGIRYGNRTPFLPKLSEAESWPSPPGANESDGTSNWYFEVVFDYGEHDAAVPTPNDAGLWPVRNDPFSSYRAGFEVRTYRLCQRVLMFHHIPDTKDASGRTIVGYDGLVRSTDFEYSYEDNPTDARNPIYSFLLSVTQTGYKSQPAGTGYFKKSLPPVEFTYSEAKLQEEIQTVEPDSLENLPSGLDGNAYQWVDLDGEGLSGILTEEADAWFYKRNLSPLPKPNGNGSDEVKARFAPVELVATKPSSGLAAGRAQFMDLAGDGQPDVVTMEGPVRGFYERTDDSGWESFRPFLSFPNLDTRDPNLKFIDLDGDGHADILISEDELFRWHPSLAEDGFGPSEFVRKPFDEEKGPALTFADGTQSVYLADMSGDGLTDIVRIRNGEVCYWPNLGYGRFGAKVTMDDAPWFDSPDLFDQRRIRLADIDGSGVTDIVYLHGDGPRLYFNQSGNSWSQPHVLAAFPAVDNLASIQVTDLLGNGTACLVWSSPLPGDVGRQMRYLDLMGGLKPHLLTKTVNNLGAETVVQYAPSTKFYLQDKQDGTPWITRLPFPVHCVERVETYDRVSRNRFVTRYSYHHGYFDGEEREFRGFAKVVQWDTAEIGTVPDGETSSLATNLDVASFVPPVRTVTWFHTGAYIEGEKISRHLEHEYYAAPKESDPDPMWSDFEATLLPDTILPPNLTLDEEREACRALKGAMLRQEVYADDAPEGASEKIIKRAGTPYTVSEQNFSIERLQPKGDNEHAVFFTHAREALSYHYERNPEDPRVGHAFTLEVDAYGNVLKSLAIGYGRRVASTDPNLTAEDKGKQTQLLISFTENRFTNPVFELNDYRTPVPAEARTYELTGFTPENNAARFSFDELTRNAFVALTSAKEIPYEQTVDTSKKQKRLIEHVRTLYRKDNLAALSPLGAVDSLALPGETYKLALTSDLITSVFKRKRPGQPDEDLLPNPAALLEGKGGDQGGYVAMDGKWWIPSGQPVFSPVPQNPPSPFVQDAAYARNHFYLPQAQIDPFGNYTRLTYDQFDLLLARSEDSVGNTVEAANDYRVLQPNLVTDSNQNRAATAFDTLGMVVATAVMGKAGQNLGDLLENFDADPPLAELQMFIADPHGRAASLLGKATTRIAYDLDRFVRCGQPPLAATLARETHFFDPGGANTKIQISFSYSDGFGREIQKKIQAEAGDAPKRLGNVSLTTGDIRPGDLVRDANGELVPPANAPRRWVGTGRTVFNNKGKPVRQYEPFFNATHLYEEEREMTDTGVSPTLFYDPVERIVATLHPNHTWAKAVFDPWQQMTYDVNDTVLNADGTTDPKSDEDVKGFFSRLSDAEYLPTWYEQRVALAANDPERIAAKKAAIHRQTPIVAHLDTLGRTFLNIAHNRFERKNAIVEEKYPTRVELDIEANQREIIDAKGRIVMRYDYDMLGNRIHQVSMEAGERWMLNNMAGKPIRAWDSRGFTRRISYDALQRPTGLFVNGSGLNNTLAEKTVYGDDIQEGPQNAETTNHRGKVYQVRDGAGVVSSQEYDFKGNLLRSSRRLLVDYKGQVDWSQAAALEHEVFTSSTRFDALNRMIQQVAPHSDQPNTKFNVTQPIYNEANLLERLDVWLQQDFEPDDLLLPVSATQHPVTNIDYNAKGQRTLIEYGNKAKTSYEYDDLTFRLNRLRTTRPSVVNGLASQLFKDPGVVQDLHYTYDPGGNITRIEDDSLRRLSSSGPPDNAPCDYTYDAIYRLIEATGREHSGQTAFDFNPPSGNRRDYPFAGLADFIAHPNDLQAVRRYIERYEYDEVGNFNLHYHQAGNTIRNRSYDYDEASLIPEDAASGLKSNRLTRTTVNGHIETYRYTDAQWTDVHGCITAINSMKMAWDFKDQLQQVDLGGGGRAYYVYDSAGQRMRKVIEKGTARNERIYLCGFEIYCEFSGATTPDLERQTLHVMDNKQRIALVDTKTHDSGSPISNPISLARCQFGNHLGSAILELDENASLVSYEEYHPYGTTSFQAGRSAAEVSLKSYRYTGKARDEETGLYYFGARQYAPWLGQWISCDPVGIGDGPNLFAFVQRNPIGRRDRDGCQSGHTIEDIYTFIRNQAGFQAGGGSQTAASATLRSRSHPPTFDPRSNSPFGTAAHAEATLVVNDLKKIGVTSAERIYSEVAVNKTTGVVTQLGGRPIRGHHNIDLLTMPEGSPPLVPGNSTLAARQAEMVGDLKYGGGTITQAHSTFGQRAVTVNASFNAPEAGLVASNSTAVTSAAKEAGQAVKLETAVAKVVQNVAIASSESQVVAGVGTAIKGASTGQKVAGALTSAAGSAGRALGPVLRAAGEAAPYVGAAAAGAQVALAESTADKIQVGVSLLNPLDPVAAIGTLGGLAGAGLEKALGVSEYSAAHGRGAEGAARALGAGDSLATAAGVTAAVLSTPLALGEAVGAKITGWFK